jgi:hypothetical protein
MSAVQGAINTLQVGALRIPCLMAQCNGVLLVGELAYRVTTTALKQLGFSGDNTVATKIANAIEYVRPYKNTNEYSYQTLATRAAACALIGTLGAEAVSMGFGSAPSIYNRVLSYLGNIRVSNERHPLLQMAFSRIFAQ